MSRAATRLANSPKATTRMYGAGRKATAQTLYNPTRGTYGKGSLYGAGRRTASAAINRAATRLRTAGVSQNTAVTAGFAKKRKGMLKNIQYRFRARSAGVKKLKRKQMQKLAKGAQGAVSGAAKKGLFKAAGAALSKIAAAAKGKIVLIGAAVVLVMCMIVAPISIFASAVGILFADENAESMTNTDVKRVKECYMAAQMAWQEEVLRGESYDRVVYEGDYADDAEVLAVFSVKLTEKDGLDAMTMEPKQREILNQVYKTMNPYTKWYTKTKDGDRILHVGISRLTADKAADRYHFSTANKKTLHELLGDYRPDLLALIAGIGGGAGGYPGEPIIGDAYKALMDEAQKYIGYPYVYGGSSPATSFDCSGYICWVYTQSGIYNLPRTTAQGIYGYCTPVSPSEAQPGDLVFFQGTYDFYEQITHIGIYVGNGKMLHCGNPIGYADITSSYWQSHFYGFGRLGSSTK